LPPQGSKVLDLCCGSGPFTFSLERLGYKVTGVDWDEKMIELAEKHRSKNRLHSKFLLGDVEHLDFADSSFDAVVFLGNPLPHFDIDPFGPAATETLPILTRKCV